MAREGRQQTFEQLYNRLEDRVGKLEAGGLSLEDAIALYEEGMALAKQCQERLEEAELKITKLKESFASLAPRTNGVMPEPADGGHASDDEAVDDEDPFA